MMINEYNFGKIVIDGEIYSDDVKIIKGRVIPRWLRKTGHSVDVEDVKDALESKPAVLVIGKGEPGMMASSTSLRRFLRNNGIELIEEKTSKAVDTFNRLQKQGKNISAALHLSC